jgi:hypothetical protein
VETERGDAILTEDVHGGWQLTMIRTHVYTVYTVRVAGSTPSPALAESPPSHETPKVARRKTHTCKRGPNEAGERETCTCGPIM